MASSDTTEGTISSVTGQGSDNASQLVFTSSDWNSVRTVTVTGVADNLSDGDQGYAIQLTGDNDTSDLRFANVDPTDVLDIGRIHIRKAQIRRVIVAGQLNRIVLIAVG